MKYLFILIGCFLLANCSNKEQKAFSKELWIKDTISYQERSAMANHLMKNDSLFNWTKKETIENLGPTLGIRKDGEIEHLSYKFHQKSIDESVVYKKYFDLYYKDSILVRYDIIEWDTLTMYKRIYFKERP